MSGGSSHFANNKNMLCCFFAGFRTTWKENIFFVAIFSPVKFFISFKKISESTFVIVLDSDC
jgi:hypothetical protein